jgi:hypothetical protein
LSSYVVNSSSVRNQPGQTLRTAHSCCGARFVILEAVTTANDAASIQPLLLRTIKKKSDLLPLRDLLRSNRSLSILDVFFFVVPPYTTFRKPTTTRCSTHMTMMTFLSLPIRLSSLPRPSPQRVAIGATFRRVFQHSFRRLDRK